MNEKSKIPAGEERTVSLRRAEKKTKAPDPGLIALRDAATIPLLGLQLLGLRSKDRAIRTKEAVEALREEIRTDVAAVRQRDPAARSDLEVLLLYAGVHAILAYRVAHRLYLGEHYLPARMVSQLARFFTGIEIHPGATIGRALVIDHGSGVVIGETTEIGDNCTLYQGVTLGGTGKDVGKRHPTLGNNVLVGSGAKVLGPLTVGDDCKIASGAVLLMDLPEGCTAVGMPARVVRRKGQKVEDPTETLDQIHIPDPVAQEFCRLEKQLTELKGEFDTLLELTAEKEKNA